MFLFIKQLIHLKFNRCFSLIKQLTRNPEDYNDANHQSHVIVALRNNSDVNNSKKFKSGDVISYVICEDGTQNSATQRAYSKSELLKSPNELKLDTKYYLTQQVHPVVTRLCEPIEQIDAFHIAKCLGLDPTGFRHKNSGGSSHSTVNIAPPQLSKQQKKIENFMNELEKFNNCIAFKYVCPNCKTEASWQSLFTKLAGGVKNEPSDVKTEASERETEEMDDDDIQFDGPSVLKTAPTIKRASSNFKCILEACANPECKLKPLTKLAYVKNLITLQMHKFTKQYYQV
jgi:hypothetical protein